MSTGLSNEVKLRALEWALDDSGSHILFGKYNIEESIIFVACICTAYAFYRTIRCSMACVGAHSYHLDFLQQLANGTLGFDSLKSLYVSIDPQSIWESGNILCIAESLQILSVAKVASNVEHLDLTIIRPTESDIWDADDVDERLRQEAHHEMCYILRLIVRTYTIKKCAREVWRLHQHEYVSLFEG